MLQGARHVHMAALNAAAESSGINIEIHELRKAADLSQAKPDALVFPGGESTTMRLTGNDAASRLLPAIFDWIRTDPTRPVLGTCAGAILLCDPRDGGEPLIAAEIDRNAQIKPACPRLPRRLHPRAAIHKCGRFVRGRSYPW